MGFYRTLLLVLWEVSTIPVSEHSISRKIQSWCYCRELGTKSLVIAYSDMVTLQGVQEWLSLWQLRLIETKRCFTIISTKTKNMLEDILYQNWRSWVACKRSMLLRQRISTLLPFQVRGCFELLLPAQKVWIDWLFSCLLMLISKLREWELLTLSLEKAECLLFVSLLPISCCLWWFV